jgi:predicted DNA-binding protein (MmcQ/YjbR family)
MANYEWLDAYLAAKKGAEKDFKAEWQAFRYMLAGKMFAMIGRDAAGRGIISLKSDPDKALALRAAHKDVTPGYYLNKRLWNSVYLDGAVPDGVLKAMADDSYSLILAALPKKIQAGIIG